MPKGKHGGARPNSGPAKGAVYRPTLDKIAAREHLRNRVIAELDPLLDSQFATAKGLKYLVARSKSTGKFDKLTAEQAEKLLSGEDNEHVVIEVWEQAPSVQAFTDLMNRALDKPIEQVEISGNEDKPITYRWQE